jgi:Tfp pilus assembly protein PilN
VNKTHPVNLIPQHRRRARLLRLRQNRWMFAVAGYALFLVVGYLGWRIMWSADGYDQSARLAYIRGDIETTHNSIAKTRAALREAGARLQANQTVTAQPDWSLLMTLIAELRGEEVVLNRCRMEASMLESQATPAVTGRAPTLSLHGHGRTAAAISQFLLKLENTQLFESVSLLKTNREVYQGGDAVAFQLECRLKTSSETPPVKMAPRIVANIGEEPR